MSGRLDIDRLLRDLEELKELDRRRELARASGGAEAAEAAYIEKLDAFAIEVRRLVDAGELPPKRS